MRISEARKAIAAGTAAFTAAITTAAQDGEITVAEWITAAVLAIGAAIATWAVPNATSDASQLSDAGEISTDSAH